MRKFLFSLFAFLLLSTSSHAGILQPIAADDLIDRSELIFTGTAVDRQVATSRDGKYPFTFITFDVQSVVKGEIDGDSLTLRFEGGEIGEEYIEVIGMPEFERGALYLLFVAGNGEAISPIVGWTKGQFQLVQHPSLPGEKVVLDRTGQAVEGLVGGSFKRTRVVRDGFSVRRPEPGISGIVVLEEDGVVISDPEAPEPLKANDHLAPASLVISGLHNRIERRSALKGFTPGTQVRSLTIDDVPDEFSLPGGSISASKESY